MDTKVRNILLVLSKYVDLIPSQDYIKVIKELGDILNSAETAPGEIAEKAEDSKVDIKIYSKYYKYGKLEILKDKDAKLYMTVKGIEAYDYLGYLFHDNTISLFSAEITQKNFEDNVGILSSLIDFVDNEYKYYMLFCLINFIFKNVAFLLNDKNLTESVKKRLDRDLSSDKAYDILGNDRSRLIEKFKKVINSEKIYV